MIKSNSIFFIRRQRPQNLSFATQLFQFVAPIIGQGKNFLRTFMDIFITESPCTVQFRPTKLLGQKSHTQVTNFSTPIFLKFFSSKVNSLTQKRSRNYCSKRLCKTLKFSSSRIRLNRMWTIIICNKLFDKRETETTGDIIRNTPIHKFVKSKNLKVKLICEKKLLTKCLGLIHLPLTGHVYI